MLSDYPGYQFGLLTKFCFFCRANLAIDLGYMYEYENTNERFELYKTVSAGIICRESRNRDEV
jgi:hypothetical protein